MATVGLSSTTGRRANASFSVDVSDATGEPVRQAVTRAIDRQKSQIAADIQKEVENRVARESGGLYTTGPGLP